MGNRRNSHKDLVELLEGEKETIDKKLQSVEKEISVGEEKKTS